MPRILRTAAACCLAAQLASAGDARSLRVGTSGDYAPFSSGGVGFDVDVAKALAHDLGMRLEWVAFRWPELRDKIRHGDMDVAMSGVTWLPDRAVVGTMSRAVAQGGPCVVGDASSRAIAVNRGGRLERWARRRFAHEALLAIDDNLSLPALLEGGAVGAIVTDSFEVKSRPLPKAEIACEPATERKVYWVAPARAADLGPAVDGWLSDHEPSLDRLRARWLGGAAPRDDVDDVVDRIARRIELMPVVGAWKHAHGLPIEDAERERRVLDHAEDRARAAGLDAGSVRRLFALQIELAKAIEARAADEAPTLDLETELRPALLAAGDAIVTSLAAAAPVPQDALTDARLAPLQPLLEGAERARLGRAILDVRRVSP